MPQNTITLETAQAWATNWRSNPANTVKAFLIPQINLTSLLAQRDTQDVRAYVGIDDQGKHTLMLVGVDANGNDLINAAEGQYIYDFTLPCPETCDVNSSLYTLRP